MKTYEIQKLIDGVLKNLVEVIPQYKISHPTDATYGDLSINVAFLLAKDLKKAPSEIANRIALEIEKQKPSFIEKVEVVNGYINFWFSKEFLVTQMIHIIRAKDTGVENKYKGKKVMVEYTDPNPFKEFHIGHLYSNSVGESIARLFEASGAEVIRANYQGDVGMHIAKSLYGIIHSLDYQSQILAMKKKTPKEQTEFLGNCYVIGAKAYEEDEKAKEEINQINKKVYEGSDESITKLYKIGRSWSLAHFEEIYKRLGTKFNVYYFESEVGLIGAQLVREFMKKDVFKESEGAIIFSGEQYGLHNRVFINSLGLPTYEAKELGLNKKKYEDYRFDASVIVTGNEINEYFRVLFKAMEQTMPAVSLKTKHIGHGMVRLPEGKMSSRKGNVMTGEWLIDETKARIIKSYPEMTSETAEEVAIGAIKYALLKSSIGHDIEFDFDTSISFEGNSGPYLQYTFARTQSILQKNVILTPLSRGREILRSAQNDILSSEELNLLRVLVRFEEAVSEAVEKMTPNIICSYLFDLAQNFNLFYQKVKVLGSEQEEIRLMLVEATGVVLKKGLWLLGIKAPERM